MRWSTRTPKLIAALIPLMLAACDDCGFGVEDPDGDGDGSGGHTVVGTRQVPCADTERMLPEVVEAIEAVG